MSNKSISWILLSFAIVVIIFIVFSTYRSNWLENHKNVFEFNPELIVVNYTTVPYLDTLALLVLDNIMEYDSMTLGIVSMIKSMNTSTMSLLGYIEKDPFIPHRYMLFVNPDEIRNDKILFIAHELVHLDQMETGRMIGLPDLPGKIFDGDTIDYYKVNYMNRPFELEAMFLAPEIEKELKKLIYKKFIW